MSKKDVCQNCVSRFICPVYEKDSCCMGHNDKEVFISQLSMLLYPLDREEIKKRVELVGNIQLKKR